MFTLFEKFSIVLFLALMVFLGNAHQKHKPYLDQLATERKEHHYIQTCAERWADRNQTARVIDGRCMVKVGTGRMWLHEYAFDWEEPELLAIK